MMKKEILFNEKVNKQPTLTVIVPIRITEGRYDLINRIDWMFDNDNYPSNITFLIVDDGSPENFFLLIKEKENQFCKVINTGAKYYQDFSLSRARNIGAKYANSEFIMFMDADLVPYPSFFEELLKELVLMDMSRHVHRFLMCPVIYLSDTGYEHYQSMDKGFHQQYFINAVMSGDKDLIEKYSSGTSVIVVERYYYLSRGGQDEGFEGWGYEDYEFSNRLIRRDRRFPLPENWLSMAGNFMTINTYSGWKAIYRLYGDWLANKGMYLFHIPHPIEEHYHRLKNDNLQYLQQRMKEDAVSAIEPEALPDYYSGKSLLFRKNPFCYNREFAPFLGECLFEVEDNFDNAKDFQNYLDVNNIDRVVFPNPYATAKLTELYDFCRKYKVPYIVCERGALPDSIYHDSRGFLNDSSSYDEDLWNNPLSEEQRQQVISYIENIRSAGPALEKQSNRKNIHEIRKELNLSLKDKVVFVPFQQPNDTVIKHFSGEIESFTEFKKTINDLVSQLGESWKVLYKKHPAEDYLEPIDGAIAVDDYHVYDLIELADAIVVINSGTGIYSMMFGKKLYVLGDSWYGHHGLCRTVKKKESLAKVIKQGFELDFEKVLRFIYYLRFNFYSFGKMKQRKVYYADGSPITATVSIDYYEVRGWGKDVRYKPVSFLPISRNSPLFDRYKRPEVKQVTKIVNKIQNNDEAALKPKDKTQNNNEVNNKSQNKNNIKDFHIKSNFLFKVYVLVYGIFLSSEKKAYLQDNPSEFFSKAKHPVSKFGKFLFKNKIY